MPHETMTYREVLEAESALQLLAGKGFKSSEAAKKVARMYLWTKRTAEEFREARKVLIGGHAKKEDGRKVPQRQQNAETGDWEDIPDSFVPEDQEAWDEGAKGLIESTVNTNGMRLTDEDLKKCKRIPEPIIYASLGPLYDWGDEEPPEEEEEEGEEEDADADEDDEE